MDAELHGLQPPTEVKTPAASTPSTLPTSNISDAATSQDTVGWEHPLGQGSTLTVGSSLGPAADSPLTQSHGN